MSDLQHTALHDLHVELGARMVPFAGYSMPVQYPSGVLREHLHTRSAAGLFDVSHMGQLRIAGRAAAAALESLVPVDIVDLAAGQQRYALLTNEQGGILDDLMVTNTGSDLYVVVNAACKQADTVHLRGGIGGAGSVTELSEHALLALQGPAAATVLAREAPDASFSDWYFMSARTLRVAGIECFVTRSGYTGEDGFELSVENRHAERVARALLAHPETAPVGLGARDSLRLEAGLCLYGNDIGPETTPVEASLSWAISKARRSGGARAGGFPGAQRILGQMESGVMRKRVGLVGDERTPVRAQTVLENLAGQEIGSVTSGGFGPSCNGVVAIAYVTINEASLGTQLRARVRERLVPMTVQKTPFFPQRYFRGQDLRPGPHS